MTVVPEEIPVPLTVAPMMTVDATALDTTATADEPLVVEAQT